MSFQIHIVLQECGTKLCQTYADGSQVLLSDALLAAGLSHDRPCGGRGVCGKCAVRVQGELTPMSEQERERLGETLCEQGYRLACVARATGTCTLYYTINSSNMQGLTDGFLKNFSLCPPEGNEGTGLAVDIGTTTVAAYLYSLTDGKRLASLCRTNPQREYGADVISRVDHAMHGGLRILAARIARCIDEMEEKLCVMADAPKPHTRVITGNTAMLHFLTATDPSPMAASPFMIKRAFGELLTSDGVTTYLPRCISAFIGADITAALLASGLCHDESKTALLMDIGTNGEMALLHDGKLICCSTAAGPALEGAGISCGAMAVDGAIDRVTVTDGKLRCHLIGQRQDIPPVGLCGTGLIDAVAALLETEELDETGYMEEDADIGGCILTRTDIRQVQLAKAAIRAGLETLLHEAGVSYDEIDEVALAGGFGSYLHPDTCAAIGLIPRELVGKIRVLGNAAGSGAAMMLLSGAERAVSEQIAQRAQVIDLSTNATFMQRYVEEMYF